MNSGLFRLLATFVSALALVSCAEEPERKAVGPPSENSRLSWTGQVTSPVQGQFALLPQNQQRR